MLEVQQKENGAYEDEIERRFKEMEEGNRVRLTIDDLEKGAIAKHAKKGKAGKWII